MILFLLLALPLAGQDFEVQPPPPAPEGRILDDARLFALKPEALEALSARVSDFSERTGYEVYVAIFNSLIGSDVTEQSRLLQEAWIGESAGVVLVMESDSAKYELGWSQRPDAVAESGERRPLLDDEDLAPQERVRIIADLSRRRSAKKDSMESAESLITTFLDSLDRAFEKPEGKEQPRWRFRVLMLGTGLMACMLLLGLLIGAWIRRSDRKVEERLIFPEVTVGMRLGAPCGGGKISSRSFDVLPRDGA
ncbi:MAG: TPM domain-containing protein [Verrucomicrobiota bacterium]